MLSLSPRYDLFRFTLPKDFLPGPVYEKYAKLLSKDPAVISDPIDYLNESIKTISFPGISDITIQQQQHSSNVITPGLGKINVEPTHDINYTSPSNPLENINKEFRIGFRFNQGLLNYFMIYETIFYRIMKPIDYPQDKVFYIELLDESGVIVSRITYTDVYIDGIDGLDFDYSKVDRDSGEFTVTFKFNNIDFDIM